MGALALVLAASAAAHVAGLFDAPQAQSIDVLCPVDDSPLASVYRQARSAAPPKPQIVNALTPEAAHAADEHMARALELEKSFRYSDEVLELTGAIHLDPTLIEAYEKRANAWALLNRNDRAMPDYDKAIELGSIQAYNWRAATNVDVGRYAEAMSDFVRAVQVNPKNPKIYLEHGFPCARFGRFKAAASDFEIAANVNPTDHYAVIWRYLTQSRSDPAAAQAEFERRAAALDLAAWPGSVVRLYLGQIGMEDVVPSPDASQFDLQNFAMEAPFYCAEYLLLHGDKKAAVEKFKIVAAIKRYDVEEVSQAEVELARLSAEPDADPASLAKLAH
jgi:lipoprotein NlpI